MEFFTMEIGVDVLGIPTLQDFNALIQILTLTGSRHMPKCPCLESRSRVSLSFYLSLCLFSFHSSLKTCLLLHTLIFTILHSFFFIMDKGDTNSLRDFDDVSGKERSMRTPKLDHCRCRSWQFFLTSRESSLEYLGLIRFH